MHRRLVFVAAAAAVGLASGCGDDDGTSVPAPSTSQRITVSSTAFADGATIPRRYTCDGENVSPPLDFSGVPSAATTLVVLAEDPDAPHGTFTHWLVWNADASRTRWAAGQVPQGAVQGRNGFQQTGYGGPCPPKGGAPHHYVFTVCAADRTLSLSPDASPEDLKRALTGHAPASGTLTGRYGR
ncbi:MULTISPECIES: YbhB/YbcL family Raf kinase inhibitor-like protein [unclassified Streptomyces]|uniref:YbhB/YbcL family Raf kinase inhibitor-like protein n=1 Tax=unclassified Streptomyces TaxID=2593676 RepID=UPI0022513C4A|nr:MULTISPECIES: YbhB/YbcL family Raf kinase inhibitor-like protein [unclassified Streptomyces]MCX5062088.1 YbhB/YbcL family Raf kinase inhibitor-like protein [Streptomyces sp. NBC_00452]MCX5292303.1 YbhB/YbcL family Raf kinase inhibitor-like protein [Streptomyces sp. NBC_00183]